MAGNDTTLMLLAGAGGYLLYANHAGLWPFAPAAAPAPTPTNNYVPAKTPATTPATTPTTPTCPTGQYVYNGVCVPQGSTCPTGQTTDYLTGKCVVTPAVGTQETDAQGNTFSWNGSAWVLVPKTCPSGQHLQNGACVPYAPGGGGGGSTTPGGLQPCTQPNIFKNGVCVDPFSLNPVPNTMSQSQQNPGYTAATDNRTITQKMTAAAGGSDGFDMDEWCYYYSQVTGSACPIDPGAVDYQAAGIDGDRSTPISISDWLGIMQTQGGQSGLSGLGDLSVTPGWGALAVAAGLVMFLGGR